MDETANRISDLSFDAGRLCLDFVNTLEWQASDNPVEHLHHYADLVEWAQRTEIVDAGKGALLLQTATKQSTEASQVLERALALRGALFGIFTVEGNKVENADLALFNEELGPALSQQGLAPPADEDAAHFRWQWIEREDALDRVLWPVLRSAAHLLTSDDLGRVKMCEDDRGCGYLFFDTSRNHSRRWCSMESCGNRAKVMRYREREEKK